MALVGDIVARFRAETADYLAKSDALKAKNRETAQSLIDAAGSAEKAMATLAVAKRSGGNALADFGIDKRNVGGITGQLKDLAREAASASNVLSDAIVGPSVRPRFDKFAQDVRNEQARQIRAMRDAAAEARVKNAAEMKLYGETADERKNRNDPVEQAKKRQEKLIKELQEMGKRAGGLGDVGDAVQLFGRGDFIAGLEKWKKGIADIKETNGIGGVAIKAAFVATVMNQIGEMTAKATARAAELRQQWEEGKISAGQMVEGIAGSLPVLGGIWQTGRNIRELITGENAEYDRQLSYVRSIVSARERSLDISNTLKEHAEAEANKNADVRASAEVSRLAAAGKTNQAADAAIRQRLNSGQQQAEKELSDRAKADKAGIYAELNGTGKEGEPNSLTKKLSVAAEKLDQIRRARKDAIDDFESGYSDADEKQVQNEVDQLQSVIRQKRQQLKEIDESAKQQIVDRKAAIAEAAEAERKAAFTQTDPKTGQRKFVDPAEIDRLARTKEVLAVVATRIGDTLSNLKFKATPITSWIERQADQAKQVLEKLKADAERFRDQVRTPAQRVRDEFYEAINANRSKPNTFNAAMLSKYASDQRAALVDERKSLESQASQRVYQLPEIKDLRGGQTLYQAPTVDLPRQQLQRLSEIKAAIQALDQTAKANGVNVQVYKR